MHKCVCSSGSDTLHNNNNQVCYWINRLTLNRRTQSLCNSRQQQQLRMMATAASSPKVELAKFTTKDFRVCESQPCTTKVTRLDRLTDPIIHPLIHQRPLHWVFKIGDLKKTLDFYEGSFGMHVHRHEEFASGCEATCNGPYGGSWSKTMVGYGREDENYALELTANVSASCVRTCVVYGEPG